MNLPAEIVEIKDGVPMVSSLQVAEKFGKRHNDTLRSIQNLEMSEEFGQRNFARADYADAQGKPRPMFWMTRDGFWALAMTFTGKEAAQLREGIIRALNDAERAMRQLPSYDVPALLEMAAKEHRQMQAEYDRAIDEVTNQRKQTLLITQERTRDFDKMRDLQRHHAEMVSKLESVAKHTYKVLKEAQGSMMNIGDMFSTSDAENVTTMPVKKDWQSPL